jgi:sugar lactone lactonase YvrE
LSPLPGVAKKSMLADSRVQLFRSIPSTLGEGALWHPTRQSLFWIDIPGQKIFETSSEPGAPTRTLPVDQFIGAVVPTASGGLFAALRDGIYRVDLTTGAITLFARAREHDAAHFRFNDAKCDPSGRLWAGTLPLTADVRESAALYRFTAEGTCRLMLDRVTLSNGLAWSLDGCTLYHIDTPTRIVHAYDFSVETGEISRPRIALELGALPGFPDGCTLDAEGCLWVAHWGGARVTRWDPVRGRLLDTLHLPVSQVTTCTFGGPNLDTLYITTAGCDLTPEQKESEPAAGFVFAAKVGAFGVPASAFAG